MEKARSGSRNGVRGVWKTWGVEKMGCVEKKTSVCKQISSLSVALDEMPTATREPSKSAT